MSSFCPLSTFVYSGMSSDLVSKIYAYYVNKAFKKKTMKTKIKCKTKENTVTALCSTIIVHNGISLIKKSL